jgi:hypothetical protein
MWWSVLIPAQQWRRRWRKKFALKSPPDLHPRRVERGIELERGFDLPLADEHLRARQRPSAAGEVDL